MKRLLAIAAAILIALPAQAGPLEDATRGRIVLDVEQNGEAWYVDPRDMLRRYLGRPDDAFSIMRSLGLGIRHAELEAYRASSFPSRLRGLILLDVELHGEAYYVYPVDGRAYYLGRPADAFAVMRELGLGITGANLARLPAASSEAIAQAVPFVSQAPYGNWDDERQQEGCEEASALMAVAWARGEGLSRETALHEIVVMSDWEEIHYGSFVDTGARDTAERLLGGYLDFFAYEVREGIGTDDMIAALEKGNVLLVPINGRILDNPYYGSPGPLRHMIVVTGHDRAAGEFIVNDPGTRRGEGMRFSEANMQASLMDYASGEYAPIEPGRTAMVIISK